MTHDRIERNPKVMMGKPVIKGTRITVELIVRECAILSWAEILDNYPRLTEDDIRAALRYAADYLGHESLIAAE
ncbi:MAG: DUF433 domain-containing protein [Caulobacteraceae bacterium]|nr:DUF433 domain-containing protein [Caulobacteraceae bacterium]